MKSPKTYVRDSGILHTLLRLDDYEQLLGHPIVGMSWEGHVIETLIRCAPARTRATYYRTIAGAEIDLLLELDANESWAIEIERSLSPKVGKGFRIAQDDIAPSRALLVYPGDECYPLRGDVEVMGLRRLAEQLFVFFSTK
uniref:DUF4143 domain-containing protein n=1 Tax=Candidatus Kentrum sp. FW TaxID=2126338 RepID=A0A450SJY2_9GAMM|nr:MAG: hypothetical protein BECKFW1821A_GA0114235_104414 [Candidatus Kentron sp. FW]VFJ58559.1 MAG: hypothetical protein BECKFW1821B_GA0114236_104214 [Candidatus Kentron sp. FW]